MVQENQNKITPIDWKILAEAKSFYQSYNYNYNYIDVPWKCNKESYQLTCPYDSSLPEFEFNSTKNGYLVASGEQSFIEMMFNNTIKPGMYQTITPCFREEKEYSDQTRPWFMKLELCHILYDSQSLDKELLLKLMINMVINFFENYISDLALIPTDIGFDLVSSGIELGSYGYRQAGKYEYLYGTGVAEPRFSIAREISSKKALDRLLEDEEPLSDETRKLLSKMWR